MSVPAELAQADRAEGRYNGPRWSLRAQVAGKACESVRQAAAPKVLPANAQLDSSL